MRTLREAVKNASDAGIGLAHFNVSDSTQFNAILAAAAEAELPVIIGVSEGERRFIGVRNVAAMVAAARARGQEVYLNADHTYSVELVKEAIDAGFDAVIFDGSHLDIEENIQKTKECVAYARAAGREVLVEGEIGRIGTSSKLLDAKPDDIDAVLTTTAEAARFVQETGVDLLAPAVGTMHGRLKSGPMPRIDSVRVGEIRAAAGVPLVLHGGSGSTDDDFVAAIKAGTAVVHVNTDIRVAYKDGVQKGLAEHPDEIAPYKLFAPGFDAVKETAARYLRLFALR